MYIFSTQFYFSLKSQFEKKARDLSKKPNISHLSNIEIPLISLSPIKNIKDTRKSSEFTFKIPFILKINFLTIIRIQLENFEKNPIKKISSINQIQIHSKQLYKFISRSYIIYKYNNNHINMI